MLRAFHNDPAVKAKYLARVRKHREADNLVKGIGWEDGKGCAIGCTLEAYDHVQYEKELGIPQMLAKLEDVIFEGLPNSDAQHWPERFLTMIEPGADLSRVSWQFLHWLLLDLAEKPYAASVRDVILQSASVVDAPANGREINKIADAEAVAVPADATYATYAAADAAYVAYAAARAANDDAYDAVHAATYQRYADKLVDLLASAPVLEAA